MSARHERTGPGTRDRRRRRGGAGRARAAAGLLVVAALALCVAVVPAAARMDRAATSDWPPYTTVSDTSEGEWNNVDVTVYLEAYSGSADTEVQSIWYQIDDGTPVTVSGSSAEFVIPADAGHGNDGAHLITFHATDTLGGVEEDQTHTVGIDTSGPGGSFKLGDGSGTTTSRTVAVDLSGLTDLAGVDSSLSEFSTDAKATWQRLPYNKTITLPAGQTNVTVWGHFVDYLGNESYLSQSITRIPFPAPEVYAAGWDISWHRSPVTFTIYAWAKYIGGVGSITYAVDGGVPVVSGADPNTNGHQVTVTIPAPADGSNDGVHTIAFSADSPDSVASETKTVQVKIGPAPAGTPEWIRQPLPAGTPMLQDVDFVDALHGWAVGQGGTILATSDGGAHWSKQTSGTALDLVHVAFDDPDHGWAVGWTYDDYGLVSGSAVFATDDGGAIWRMLSLGSLLPTGQVVFGVTAVGPDHVWLSVGSAGLDMANCVLASADGGTSWTKQDTGVSGYIGGIDFVDENQGWTYVGCFDTGLPIGIVLHTVDGGAHWTSHSLDVMTKPFDVFALDGDHVWVSGYEHSLVGRTADGGASWQTFIEGYAGIDMRAIAFSDAANGWGVHKGYGDGIYRTIDGGATWQPFLAVPIGWGSGLDVIDGTHAWVAGGTEDSGLILRYTVPTTTDDTPPATSAALSPAANATGWNRAAVTVTLAATDSGSGVDKTFYRFGLSGAFSVYDAVAKPQVAAEGETVVQYYSTDQIGNLEATKSLTVRIDSVKPATKAYAASIVKGRTVRLGYQVLDPAPSCGKAKVTLKVFKGAKLMLRVKVPGTIACNLKKTYPWRCTLARGFYTVKVYATDIAGNGQSKIGSARLTVK